MSAPWLEGAVSVNKGGSSGEPPKAEAPKPEKSFLANELKAGLAEGTGAIADVLPRIVNLIKAGVGMSEIPTVLSKLTGRPATDFMPEVNATGVMGYNQNTEVLKGLYGVEDITPSGPGEKLAGGVLRAVGGSVGGGPAVSMAPKQIATQIGLSGLAGAGAESAGAATDDNPWAKLVGGMVAGVAAPAVVQGRAQMFKDVVGAGTDAGKKNAAPWVKRIVDNQVKSSVSGAPNVAENITEALALRQRIPGFNPSVAEMADSPALADIQRRYAMSSPKALNTELARDQANTQAIRQFYENSVPAGGSPGAVRSAVNQNLADSRKTVQGQAQGVAGELPVADQAALGTKLTDIAASEKAAARVPIQQAYNAAFEAAGSAPVSVAPVIAKVEEILGTKLSQIKADSAPQTVRKLQELAGKTDDLSGRSIPPDLMALRQGEQVAKTNLTLKDVDDIRKAINADIASAGMSMDPIAAQKLRNLGQVQKTIDETIQGSAIPDAAKSLYFDAVRKYREEFAPRFKEGSNLKVFKDTSLNEPRILNDKFVAEYFKPDSQGGNTKAMQFAALFGKNKDAREAAKTGVMDIYRQRVIDPNTGTIDPARHNAFVKDYGRTLDTYRSYGVNAMDDIKRVGEAAVKAAEAGKKIESLTKTLKFDTVDDLVNASLGSTKVMGNAMMRMTPETRQTFNRLLLDKAWESGKASGMADFIAKHEKTLKLTVPQEQINNLKDIAKALQISERAPIRGALASAGQDMLKQKTGVSTATVWAQYRATAAGRQGPATMMFNLAAPVMTKLSQTQFTEIMEEALHNPKTAENLRNFLLAETPAQANKFGKALTAVKQGGEILWSAKGPILKYGLGTPNYKQNLGRTAIPLANTVNEEQ